MAGCVIPGDWDGVTYQCTQVMWPGSENWRAILLGQMTELCAPSYWDASTGDDEIAAAAAEAAYQNSIASSAILECQPMNTVSLLPDYFYSITIPPAQSIVGPHGPSTYVQVGPTINIAVPYSAKVLVQGRLECSLSAACRINFKVDFDGAANNNLRPWTQYYTSGLSRIGIPFRAGMLKGDNNLGAGNWGMKIHVQLQQTATLSLDGISMGFMGLEVFFIPDN